MEFAGSLSLWSGQGNSARYNRSAERIENFNISYQMLAQVTRSEFGTRSSRSHRTVFLMAFLLRRTNRNDVQPLWDKNGGRGLELSRLQSELSIVTERMRMAGRVAQSRRYEACVGDGTTEGPPRRSQTVSDSVSLARAR